jgi:methionyl-tRNA formyltransferase
MKMRLVYFSKGPRGISCLKAAINADHTIAAAVGVKPDPALEALSKQFDFPVLYPERVNAPENVAQLKAFKADCFVLSGYNRILKSPVIEIPPLGTINLHGGKLPDYRGAAPINWQIINGEVTGGCCIIYVDEGIDTGDIIAQEIYPITPDDTHASVLQKTLDIFPPLLVKVLGEIEAGTVKAKPQDPTVGGYYCRRYPRDSQIDWKSMTDLQVHNLVRGMHGPYPAAFTSCNGQKVEIDQTQLLEETIRGIPGRVPHKRGNSVVVLTANRGILVEKITVDNKKVDPADFFQIGDDLGPLLLGGS